MAGAVEKRYPQDRVIPADDFVGEPRPEERHEIIGEDEKMHDRRRGIDAQPQAALGNFAGDIAGEDPAHAVIAEPFAGLIADDELDLAWPSVGGSLRFGRRYRDRLRLGI